MAKAFQLGSGVRFRKKLKKFKEGIMNDDILNFDKVQLLRDELIEVCSEWNLTTREKVTALHVCLQKVVDKSGMKLGEGFSSPIRLSQYSRKS
jgi:hypothetical protein